MNMALAGLAMLIIGDSHIASIGYFNNALNDELVAQGATVQTFGVCDSAPVDWVSPGPIVCGRGERHNLAPASISPGNSARGWALTSLISEYTPNIVVIELGDNMAGYGVTPSLPRDLIASQVHDLLRPIVERKLPCIWIGPPWGTEGGVYKKTNARVKELSDFLSSIVTPCHYVDSLAFAQPGQWSTIDGVHLTIGTTRIWDNDIVRSIDQIAERMPRH
jgi:hypothetical protein